MVGEDTVRDTTISAQSSMRYDDSELRLDEMRSDELNKAISSAKSLIRQLNSRLVKSPMDERTVDNLEESGLSFNKSSLETPSRDLDDHEYGEKQAVTEEKIIDTISSLVKVLDDSTRQIQQLKLKNMLLRSNSNDIQSTYEVEENLKKQQYERMKCQFLAENQQLVENLRIKEGKVAKYKSRIVEKNRQINKLTRILNEGSGTESSSSQTPGSTSKEPARNVPSNNYKEKASDMLKTLGILASQVLNEEVDDDSGNQTIPQAADNTTDPEIVHAPILGGQLSRAPLGGRKGSDTPKDAPVELPEMRSFRTLNGVIRNSG